MLKPWRNLCERLSEEKYIFMTNNVIFNLIKD